LDKSDRANENAWKMQTQKKENQFPNEASKLHAKNIRQKLLESEREKRRQSERE